MMFMLGLISSCTCPFLQTYPKMAFNPQIRVQISLYGNKLRHVEGVTLLTNGGGGGRGGTLLYTGTLKQLFLQTGKTHMKPA